MMDLGLLDALGDVLIHRRDSVHSLLMGLQHDVLLIQDLLNLKPHSSDQPLVLIVILVADLGLPVLREHNDAIDIHLGFEEDVLED